jgi:hypothetical protein
MREPSISIFYFSLIILSLNAWCAPFSPEELLGTYLSKDKIAKVKVYKKVVSDADLFNPAKYEYFTDISFNAGKCMTMYSSDPNIELKGLKFRYNGDWLPKNEYLSAEYRGDSDYDGSVYVDSVDFTATKKHYKSGKTTIKLSLDFSVSHNPDPGDGGDGGVAQFEKYWKETKSRWNDFQRVPDSNK